MPTVIRPTFEEGVRTLIQIAKDKPDHIDQNALNGEICEYSYGDGTRCIAGEWLHRYGVSDEFLVDLDEQSFDGLYTYLSGSPHSDVHSDVDIALPEGLPEIIQDAQNEQDHAEPWADAVRYALRNLPEFQDELREALA